MIKRTGRYFYGERNPKSKLDPNMVRAIRASTESGVALAARHGVSPACISHTRNRVFWRHVA